MLNWFTSWFKRDHLQTHRPHIEAVARHHQLQWQQPTHSHAQVYSQSSWVYVAINHIAQAAALVPLHVYRLEGEQQLEVIRHPLEVLLDAPNPYMSRFELFEQSLGMLELTGNAYWFLVGDAHGRPAEIWPLHPDRVTIVPDTQQYVRGYIYEIDGRQIPLEPVEVIHFKRWHPANDYYGLSALDAASLAIRNDLAMSRWNHNTFGQDNGVPAGIVTIRDSISDTDFERIKREWRQSYGGTQRRTAFLRGGSVEWQNIGLSHTELDFLKGRLAHRDEILNIFGVPVGLISENATEANARVAERQFIERTLWPRLVRFAAKISQELLPFYPGRHVAAFEDIRPTDTETRLAEIRTAYPLMSINEIRERYYHMPAISWGGHPVGAAAGVTSASTTEPDEIPSVKSALDELNQWERFALKRLDKSSSRRFEVRALPEDTALNIHTALLTADDRDAIKGVFASARDALMAS